MVAHPRAAGGVDRLRVLNQPRPVVVPTGLEGEPVAVMERGAARRVIAIQERWRIVEEWWREPIARDYYRVLLEDGSVRTLYTDNMTGHWFAQNY